MSKPIITVENLSKRYHLGQIGAKTLRESTEGFMHRLKRRMNPQLLGNGDSLLENKANNQELITNNNSSRGDEFWALKDVSFEVQPGEVLGIIGRNGAGKSTLLKILSRITDPTSGRAIIRGRVASLLEVGTGFHPELTGRENIFLNGAILGMKKAEISRKFDEIVAFAEVERFIDTPVKRYSSGMYVRLAFAVAAHMEPEILVIDEVLAVGDIEFQKKCLGKMGSVARGGKTVLFVSHNLTAVAALCNRLIVIADGVKTFEGAVQDGIGAYLQATAPVSGCNSWSMETAPGDNMIKLLEVDATPLAGKYLDIDSGVRLRTEFWNNSQGISLDFTVYVSNDQGVMLFETGTVITSQKDSKRGKYEVIGEIPPHLLNAGGYMVTLLFGQSQRHVLLRLENVYRFEIENSAIGRGNNLSVAPGVTRPKLNFFAQWKGDGDETKT